MNYIRLFQKNMLKNGIKPSKQEKRTHKNPLSRSNHEFDSRSGHHGE